MPEERTKRKFLVLVFAVIIFGAGLTQAGVELCRGNRPQAADLFTQAPTEANLRTFEKDLEDSSWLSHQTRPWMQYLQFVALNDAGEKAVAGRDGWLFYRPGVDYLVQAPPGNGGAGESVSAIVSFRDKLASRGIRLLVVPVPGKASVYPEMLTSRAVNSQAPVNTTTLDVIARLREAGVEVIDLVDVFSRKRADPSSATDTRHYLAQDTHWTPEGMRLAAKAVAQRILDLGWVEKGTADYELKPVTIQRIGDVLQMMQVPQIERRFTPETIQCTQVIDRQTGGHYHDEATSEVLVLGDSFLRIYEHDDPGSGGFIAHLAHEMQFPLASIVNDGGASTLVRQELNRKPALLDNKRVVVWEFVERDIRFGTEGWQDVPLPEQTR